MHAARNAGGSRRSWAPSHLSWLDTRPPPDWWRDQFRLWWRTAKKPTELTFVGDIELSDRDTGYRHPPDWDFWLSFGRPDTGYRKLPSFGAPDNRKGVAVGYPFRSPWFDNSDGAAPLLVADWRGEPLPDLDRTAADRGERAARKEEREFARSLRKRAGRVANVDFSEPKSEADDSAVAAHTKLGDAQMTIWAEAEADGVKLQEEEEAAQRLGERDRTVFWGTLDRRTQADIAEELGVTQQAISKRFKGIM